MENDVPLHSIFQRVMGMIEPSKIQAISELLDTLQIKGYVVTIDAMGTQIKIAEKIVKKRADYVLAIKGNQETLYRVLSNK